jgi:hypothetical protein
MNTLQGSACMTTLFFAVSALADPNTLDTQGSGGNSVYTDQSGSSGGSLIDIYQVGIGTNAGRNYAGTSTARIVQTGGGNIVRIGQGATYNSTLSDGGVWGGGGSWTETSVPVQSNQATVQQSGVGQRAEIYQTGNGNTATVIQSGGAAQAALTATQAGNATNILYATQSASGAGGLTANIEQNGGGTVNLSQSGENSLIKVVNQTGGVANLIQQGIGGAPGTGNTMILSNQSAHTVTLTQQDVNRTVTVTNPATDVTITQTPGH